MSAKLDISGEFAALANQLQSSPNDQNLKLALLRRLPEMKALAQVNSLALYRLAQIYPKGSAQYQQLMTQAADRGCTNAMLDLCHVLLKTKSPNDLQKAVQYMNQIARSDDSYIISQSLELLDSHPQLSAALKAQNKRFEYQQSTRFFSKASELKEQQADSCYRECFAL